MTSEQLQDHHDKLHNTNWKYTKLDDIITLEYGKGLTKESRDNGEYPVYGSNGIVGYHSDFLIEGPTIIVGRKGTVGAICWSKYNCWPIDTTYYVKKKSSNIDDCWLYYKLKSLTLSKLNMGTGIPGLNRDHVYSTNIQLPPLSEQRKIASILSKVDEHISHTEAIIEKNEELKKGLMQQLLTKGIGHTKFKKTEIGEIPEEWDVVYIEDVAAKERNSFKRGPFGGSLKKEIFVPSGYKVYEQKNAIYNDFSIGTYYITKEKYGEMVDFSIRPEDLIISCSGTLGKVAIVPYNLEEGIINQALLKITIDKSNFDVHFVKYLFESDYVQTKLIDTSLGSAMKNMASMSIVKKSPILKPSLPEQQKIVSILSKVDDQLSQNQTYLSHLQELKKGLMQDLLTGKVRVTV